jgi:hypothetical protein
LTIFLNHLYQFESINKVMIPLQLVTEIKTTSRMYANCN